LTGALQNYARKY